LTEAVLTSGGAVTATRPLSGAPMVDAPFASALVELGHERPEVVVVSADLSKYTDVAPSLRRSRTAFSRWVWPSKT